MSPTDLCTMVVMMRGTGELQAIGIIAVISNDIAFRGWLCWCMCYL